MARLGDETTNRDSVLSDNDGEFDVGDTKVQMSGMLMKQPFGKGGKKKQKWQKRFFIAKDGFLLYYSESECKSFQKDRHFNIHPKGVIPLGSCIFMECVEGSQKFAIKISHRHFKGEIIVGTENQEDCSKWITALRDCSKVTFRNAQLGENIVQQLERKSKAMAKEKQEVINKLNEEASQLEVEKEKKEELERLAAELAEEKKAIEKAAMELRQDKDTTEQELKGTLSAMQQIEEEKSRLFKQTESLQANLESVTTEKDLTTAQLEEREKLTKQLEEEKKTLEEATSHLKGDLMSLEEHSKLLELEKITTEERLKQEAETAGKLKEEVRQISDTALHLQSQVKEVAQAKEETQTAYQHEKKRRINTERRLRLAEDSLKRLDRALKESGIKIDLQIETDVKNLKQFFEDTIAEEEYEAQKLDIMRDALRSKATYNIETKKMGNDCPPMSPPPIENGTSSPEPNPQTKQNGTLPGTQEQ